MAVYLLICMCVYNYVSQCNTWEVNGKVPHNKGLSDCWICAVKQQYFQHVWNLESALVASLCFDDLFHSELIIEFMLKNSLFICCYWKSGGGWVSTKQPLWGVIMKWRWFSYLLAPSWKVVLILQPGALEGTASKRWWVLQGGKWWMEDMVITT